MENRDTIRLEFTYVYEDFHQARETRTWRQRCSWVDIVGWTASIAAGVAVFVLYSAKMEKIRTGADSQLLGLRSLLPYLAVAAVGYMFWRFGRGGRAAWEKSNPPQVMVVTISAAGIVWEFATSCTEQRWATYQRFEETEKGFVLIGADRTALIPARVMNEEQTATLRKLLAEHVFASQGFEVLPKITRNLES